MASVFTQLRHSFITTLFYLWTVIQALVSLRSPGPFPFHESAIIVPYPPDIDLERGTPRRTATNGKTAIPACISPPSSLPTSSREATDKAIQEDADRQEKLRRAAAISMSFGPVLRIEGAVMSASDESESDLPLATTVTHQESTTGVDPDHGPSVEVFVIEETPFMAPDLSCNPFLEESTLSLSSSTPGTDDQRLEDSEAVLFTLPYATSTPPRTRRGGKGHKRAALATITNILHLKPFESLANSPPVSRDDLNLLGSPSASCGPVPSTPITQRMRSPSLRRKPAYGDLHSGSPTRSTPSKRPASVVWFTSSSIGTPLKSVDPLNIVKRNSPSKAYPINDLSFTASESMNTDEVRSTVREAFVHLHANHLEDDEGAAARELINRESVFTSDRVSTAASNEGAVVEATRDDSDDDEEYGEELTDRPSRSPPPPYAFADPEHRIASNVDVKTNIPPILGTFGLKPDVCGQMIPACSVPPSATTELSYLQGDTTTSSAYSSLDDIITSFEHLMSTMSPNFQASMITPPTTAFSEKATIEDKETKVSEKSSAHSEYDELLEEYAAQWSEVLLLDTY